jgi:hypothetical protein
MRSTVKAKDGQIAILLEAEDSEIGGGALVVMKRAEAHRLLHQLAEEIAAGEAAEKASRQDAVS